MFYSSLQRNEVFALRYFYKLPATVRSLIAETRVMLWVGKTDREIKTLGENRWFPRETKDSCILGWDAQGASKAINCFAGR